MNKINVDKLNLLNSMMVWVRVLRIKNTPAFVQVIARSHLQDLDMRLHVLDSLAEQ